MGKIRVKTLGVEELEEQEKKAAKKRIEVKKEKKAEKPNDSTTTPMSASGGNETKQSQSEGKSQEAEVKEEPKKAKSSYAAKLAARKSPRSKKYATVSTLVDKNKNYTLAEALKLLPELKTASFDETVELHINTTEAGISTTISLPHGTGKQIRVAIADDKIIEEVTAGKINFDILIATPQMMPKLARVAKFLGPKGLMPNPKNGTISPNPEEAAKKFAAGQMQLKTEAKNPIMHVSVGKVSFGEEKLTANIKTVFSTVQKARMVKVVLKSTMSPGIKLDLTKI